MVALPSTLSNGSVIDAVPLQAILDVLADSLELISNTQIIEDAGISKSKIAERWSEETIVIPWLPATSGADLQAPALFTTPTAMTVVAKFRVTVQSGCQKYLCVVEHHVLDHTSSSPDFPLIDVRVDSEQVGGDEHTIDTDNAYYTFSNASPLSNPLIALSDGAEIEIRAGETSGASPALRAVTTRLVIKTEHIS